MTLKVRRVVTGHDESGRAKVMMDGQMQNVFSPRPGAAYSVIWSTDDFPISNDVFDDASNKNIGTSIDGGTVFRVVSFAPGVSRREHRTNSIDYGVVMSGELDMELDDGATVHLKAGDVIVQRGTIHNWVNNGTEPCLIAFTLISAKPVSACGKRLSPRG